MLIVLIVKNFFPPNKAHNDFAVYAVAGRTSRISRKTI